MENNEYDGHVAFAAGFVTRFCEDYAGRTNLPSHNFALRVSELVFTAQGGEIHRPEHSLSLLSTERPNGKATEVDKTPRKVAVAKRAHSKASPVGRPSTSATMRDKTIVMLSKRGKTPRELALQFDLSTARIHQIIMADRREPKVPRKKNTPVTCRLCNTTLPSRSDYNRHFNTKHPEQKAARDAKMRESKGLPQPTAVV